MAWSVQGMILQVFKLLPDSALLAMSGGKPMVVAGRTLDPMMQLLAVQGKKAPPMTSMTVTEARTSMGAGLAPLGGKPRPMANIVDRTIPGPAQEIPVRVYRPLELDSNPALLLYFHQGGCCIGDVETCHPWCTLLADRARCIVMSVDYRLAPEHKFPAAPEDAVAAYRWATDHAGEVGADPERVAVAGDSAGGGLAAVITHTMKKEGGQQPLLQVLIYPWLVAFARENDSYTDFGDAFPLSVPMMEWFGGHYLNSPDEAGDPRVSPLLENDFTELAPAIVVTAGYDPLHDEGEAYAAKLREAGVKVTYINYDHLTHAFTALGGAVTAAQSALYEISGIVRDKLAETTHGS